MKHFVLTLLGLLSFCLAIRAEVYSGECGDNGNNLTWTLDTETGKLVISGNGDITQNPWIDYRNYIRSVDIQEGVKSIGDNAFRSCYLITNARIPDSVIDIGDNAFRSCYLITNARIPDSVIDIGDNAFYDCFGLKSIVIGRSVTSIGIQAFTSCSNLRTIINFSSLAITKGSTSNGSVAFNAYQVVSNPNSIEENFVFSIIDGVNTLMAYIGDDTKIVLPDNYRGEGYVIGENAFCSNLTVTSIVIPDNVTSIGDWAFFNCRLLESINIPNSITDIGDMAFRQCSKLKNIILSNTLRSVGYRIFYDCIELESMEIPNSVTSIGKEAFYNCVSLKDVTIGSNVMSIGEYAFASCETLANVKMPCSITKIEEYAFNGCEALTFIIIPPSVTSLGRRIFEGCRNLKTIINLSSIQFIISSNDNYSHMPKYSDIIKIDAPNGSIEGDYVFGIIEGTNTLCKYLGNDSDIILPYNYKGGKYKIGAEAFSNNETISNVMIPDGIINIGNDAFEYCTSLTGITIPNSVTSIGNRAFYSCYSLTSVTIGNSVTKIGAYAFYDCSGLTSVTIGNSVTSIGSSAFNRCSGLTSMTIPNSVTSIEHGAFSGCSGLQDVYSYAEKVPSTNSYAFYESNYSNATLHVPDGSIESYRTTEPWSGFGTIKTLESFSGEVEIDGINYELNGETKQAAVIKKSSGKYSGEVVIPESVEHEGTTYSVTSIGSSAFFGCSGLTSVTIPNSVTSIGEKAFYDCDDLTSVTIPNSVTSIGHGAFSGCSGLQDVYSYAEKVPSTNSYAFDESNYSNATLHVPDGSIESYRTTEPWSGFGTIKTLESFSGEVEIDGINYELNGETKQAAVIKKSSGKYSGEVVIPESVEHEGAAYSVTSIGGAAFSGCSGLTSVTIPNSVTSIGKYAFSSCSGLTSVTIPNSVSSIVVGAFGFCSGLTEMRVGANNPKYDSRENCNAIIETASNTLISGCQTSVIPNGVTSIGAVAFYGCSGLTSVTIPNSVTSIGAYAFDHCSGLTSVTIGNSVMSIGEYAFCFCDSLHDVYCYAEKVPSTGSYALNSSIIYSNATLHVPAGSIESYRTTEPWSGFGTIKTLESFSGEVEIDGINYELNGETKQATVIAKSSGSYSDEVVIPESVEHEGITYSVTSIGEKAFYDCDDLTSVTIPNSVTSIGDNAFFSCSGLTSVTIPNSVTSIGGSAFWYCSGLTSVHISDIAAWCNIEFGNGTSNPLSNAPHLYLNGEEVKDLVIPNSVTSIGSSAFYGCSGLTSVTIPNSVTSIGWEAFRGCSGLTSVTIPNSITSIGSYAFNGCTSLSNITIPSGISKIENYTFEDCISLTRITIPDNITEIGEYAFRGCRKINKLLIGSSVNSIKTNAFEYCSGLTLLVLPKSLRWVSSNAFHGCTNLKTVINFSSETPKSGEIDCGYAGYYAERIANRSDGNMYLDGDFVFNRTNSGNELLAYLGSESDITLPDWSNNGDESYSISGGIFKNDKTVISITVPKSVIEIGSEAFYGTGWWNNQEDGLLYLDSWIIGYKGQSPKGEIIINEGTTGIANYAFEWCGITSVKIPNSVINIGYGAFYYCKSLSSITCLNPISPTCGNNAFYNVSTSSCQLLVPASAIEAYTTTSPWSTFTNIEALPLTDGEDFENTEEQKLKTITYTRTLPNLYWNALYVPFEIPVSEIIDKYEVAYVNNINSYDHNDDGTIDDMRMEVIKIKSGTLNANYPYLIKARNDEARSMNLTLENTTLFQSVETTIDCSSVFAKHEITGIYNKRYKNELPDGAMAISMAGAWQPIASGSYLNPFRLYMTITARDGSPVKVEPAAMSRIRISVLGEDVETDIEETRSETKNIILDLSGRSVQNPVKGGVYIVNGKKVIF